MIENIAAFQAAPLGSAENAALGEKLVASMTSNMLFIGTVAAPFPVYHRNALKNFTQFTTASYEYYRTYPYLPQQWYLSE